MEDTHNTHSKKSNALDHKVYLAPSIKNLPQFQFLKDYLCLDETEASIKVDFNQSNYVISNINTKSTFVCSMKNMTTYLQDKVLIGHQHFSDIDFSNTISKNPKPNSLEIIFAKSSSIQEYIQLILAKTKLSVFSTVHLFIHPRGKNMAYHETFGRSSHQKGLVQTEDFFELYNAIKKSKERTFGQSSFKASKYNIIGTCVGREFTLTNHDVILFFSRNDMIPMEYLETTLFENEFYNLVNHINVYISNKEAINNISIYTDLFDNILNVPLNKNWNASVESAIDLLQVETYNEAEINHQERISLLGDLLNTLRHELSNPLFGLQLSAEVLKFEQLDSEQEMFLGQIEKSIRRSQKIIENFSEFFSDNLEQREFDLIELIEEVFTLTKSESRAISKNLYLDNTRVSGDLKYSIHGHPTSIAQILFNLIINSVQAIKEGKTKDPAINIYLSEEPAFLNVKVVDNGPGVLLEHQKDFFKPFYTTKVDGTGLGLAICLNLAKKIQGDLSYKPTKTGSIFVLRIPK